MRASCTRCTSMRSTRSHTAVSAIGSASIVNPGLTPVPSTATLAFARPRRAASPAGGSRGAGYAASSVVVTIGTRRLSTSSNCGSTRLSDELVQSTATSGLAALIVLPMSAVTFTRSRRPSSMTSPASLPDLLRIDVDGADDLKSLARRELPRHRRADRAEPDVHHANRHPRLYAVRFDACRIDAPSLVRPWPVARCRARARSSCLIDMAGLQRRLYGAGVQTFDQPRAGARSPRNANYDIDVRLDHAARTLHGRETIRWRNISATRPPSCSSISTGTPGATPTRRGCASGGSAGNYTAPRDDAWGSIDVSAHRACASRRHDARPDGADSASSRPTTATRRIGR